MRTEKKAKVSVIMPVHNEPKKILEGAIHSILSQSFPVDEFILCDDGSNADTRRFLEALRDEMGITLVINKTSHGAASARNSAIEKATGSFIALMDADDLSDSGRLKKEYEFLVNNPQYSFVGCKGEFFKNVPGDVRETYWFVRYPEPKDFLVTLPFVHASLMLRREALLAVGGYRKIRRVKRSEDYDLLLRLYEAGYTGANLPERLYHIRRDEAALKRRKYRYRFGEAAVKLEGFVRLGLMPAGILYAIKPLFIGLLPIPWLEKLKRIYYAKKDA